MPLKQKINPLSGRFDMVIDPTEHIAHVDLTDMPDAAGTNIDHDARYARQGLDAAKGAAGTAGRRYWATDTEILYWDNGAAWVEMLRGESVTRLAQLAEKDHASLTSVLPDQHHARSHVITTIADHTSGATPGQMLKANANGLPVDATNTDTDVADAVTKKHSQNTDTDLDATFEATFVKHTDVDDVPVDGVTTDPISSNWAYNHALLRGGPVLTVAANDTLAVLKARADYVCDGTADQIEIQAAIDALPATGGEVRLLDGTFNITASINLDYNQTLRGSGKNTILTTTTANLVFISAVGGAGTEKTEITVSDMQIDGATVSNCGIYFEYVDYSLVQNVYSRRHNGGGFKSGIYLYFGDYNIISGNTCQGNSDGIYFSISVYNIISGNTCQGNSGAGISINPGSKNNTIVGNICQGNSLYGIYLDVPFYITLIGNTFQGNGYGIYGYQLKGCTITGNICQGNTYDGIFCFTSCTYNTIAGNTCQGNSWHGIYLYGSDNNTITGNTCQGNSQTIDNTYSNIYLESSDYNLLIGNLCRDGAGVRQPKYGINISNATCNNNTVEGNDLYDSGRTGDLNDAGTDTLKRNNVALAGTWLADDNCTDAELALHEADTSTHGAADIADVSDIAVDTNLSVAAQAAVAASHARQHAITAALDHTSGATPAQMLKADANGLPVDATNTDAQVAAAVAAAHARQHAITAVADHTSGATPAQMLKADANGLPVDATNTDAQVAAAVAAAHARQHNITAIADHLSGATPAQMLKADANGLPVDATNTDAQVAAAVAASHAQIHKDTHKTGGGDAFAVADLLDGISRVKVRKNTGADVGSRRRLNLIEGANITLTVADDVGDEEVDITVAAAGGSVATDVIWDAAGDVAVGTGPDAAVVVNLAVQQVLGRLTAGNVKGLTVAELVTLALSAALPENVAISLVTTPLSADGKYSGIVEAGVAGAILAFGDLVYFAVADSRWELTDADTVATAKGKIGICVLAAADGAATTILLWGKVNAAAKFPVLTIGAPVHLSTTPGAVQVAAPIGTTDTVRIVGYGNTADELFFCPDNTYLELA